MMIIGSSGASSGKAEEEGHAGAMVDDDNAARGVIWAARSHSYLLDGTLTTVNLPVIGRVGRRIDSKGAPL
jgi:hypothetical protein